MKHSLQSLIQSLVNSSRRIVTMSALFLVIVLSVHLVVRASPTLGTIDPNNTGAYKALVQNTSLGSATSLNFGKFTTQSAKNITVSDTELRGFAWGEGVGWVVVNCTDTTSGCSGTNSNFKVANDGSGNLSGYAWGEQTGWINFGPFTNAGISTVKITNGQFGGSSGSAGYAWSQNYGFIKFDCSSGASCVTTDWGVTAAETCSDGIQNQDETGIDTGGVCSTGGGGGGTTDVCPNIIGVQSSIPPGKVKDTAGNCVDPTICPNTVNYDNVPLSSAGPFLNTVPNVTNISFAIKNFYNTNPATTAGDIYTQNILNPQSHDQVVVYNPLVKKFLFGFEDVINGDNDFNDLVVDLNLYCGIDAPCATGNTEGDTTTEAVNPAPPGEQGLQAILNGANYVVHTITNQKQYQSWIIPANSVLKIRTQPLAKYAGHTFVFGYYTDGNPANFVPIYKTGNVLGSQLPVPALCIPNPSDLCPNIVGAQTVMPPGKALNTAGQCVDIVYDVCPNIAGNQLTVPNDMMYDGAGNCVPLVVPPTDFCPNINGVQSSVPANMIVNVRGECVANTCVNNPAQCVPPPDPCVLNPASCVPPPDLCTTNPELCVPPPDHNCTTNPELCVPPPDTCATNPALCSPGPTYCSQHPEACVTPDGVKVFGIDFFPGLRGSLRDMLDALKTSINTSVVAKISPLLAVTALAVASLLPVISAKSLGFSDILLLIGRLWTWLLVFFGIKKKAKPWGTVYDSVTKEPIDPAYVVLQDLSGNEIATSITDIEGRYGFAVPAGTYVVVANKSNYQFPSQKLSGKTNDELYDNLYFGGPITVTEEGGVIAKNIPLDQLNFDWNEYAKNIQHRLRHFKRSDLLVAQIANGMFVIGFLVSLLSVFLNPSTFNVVVIAIYVFMTFYRRTRFLMYPRGSVSDLRSNQPLPFSVVRVYSTATSTEITRKVADKRGTYYALVANGRYRITVDRKNADQSYTSEPLLGVVTVKKGVLKENFKV